MVSLHSNYLVGSMGAGNQIMDLFVTIFSFLSVGCSVVIAQALGARDFNLAKKAMHQSLFLNSLLGFICAMFIVWHGEWLLSALNVPSGQFNQAVIYLKMIGICLFFDSIGIILAAIIRVYNMAYFVAFVSVIMNLIGVGLNYYTLNFTDLELFGVACATIIGRVCGMIILIFVLIFKLKIKLILKEFFIFQKSVLQKVLKIGGFSAGENLTWILQYTIALSFIYKLGEANASVQTIYFQISMLIMLCGQAFSLANEIIVGKLVGAHFSDIAYKHTWRVLQNSLIGTAIVVLLFFIFKHQIMGALDLENELKNIMLPLFSLSIILELGRTFNIVMVNALRASGDAKFPFIMGLIFMLGISLPIGYFCCFYLNLGIIGVYIGFICDEWFRGLANAARWKSRKWQNKAVV